MSSEYRSPEEAAARNAPMEPEADEPSRRSKLSPGRRSALALCLLCLGVAGAAHLARRGAGPAPTSATTALVMGLSSSSTVDVAEGDRFLVFLKAYPMGPPSAFHTAIAVCRRSEVLAGQRGTELDQLLPASSGTEYVKVPDELWQASEVNCGQIEYPGDPSVEPGAGILYTQRPLNSHVSFESRQFEGVETYLFGLADHSAAEVKELYVQQKLSWLGKFFAGTDFDIHYNNCNYFTTHALACAYGFKTERPIAWWAELVPPECATSYWNAAS